MLSQQPPQNASKLKLRRMPLGTVRQWHWVSSAVCLAALLLFAVTGITLNHAQDIEASPRTTTLEQPLDHLTAAELRDSLQQAQLTPTLQEYLESSIGHRLSGAQEAAIEWAEDELYLSLPRPGGDAWLSLDVYSETLIYESTSRGFIAYLNDLHKGRHTGPAWSWFIDVVAILCVIFAATGLWLLARQHRTRPSTWPLTTLGLLVPILLLLFAGHGL